MTRISFHLTSFHIPSALLGFLLLLATVKLNSGFPLEEGRAWVFLSKVTADFFSACCLSQNYDMPTHRAVENKTQIFERKTASQD